jgi:hypothetical protein
VSRGRETLQRTAETVKSTETNLEIGSEIFQRNLKNPLDRIPNPWYNKDVIKRGKPP